MSFRRGHGLALVIAAALALGAPAAQAAEPWLGTWKITEAKIAPWAAKSRGRSDVDLKELLNKTVTFRPREIAGPPMLICKGPKYKLSDFSADMLFQGAFGEMHLQDKSVDPVTVAASVGFRGSRWKTLETGCAVEIDYHFIDPATAAFGLNDYVYTLKKQP